MLRSKKRDILKEIMRKMSFSNKEIMLFVYWLRLIQFPCMSINQSLLLLTVGNFLDPVYLSQIDKWLNNIWWHRF